LIGSRSRKNRNAKNSMNKSVEATLTATRSSLVGKRVVTRSVAVPTRCNAQGEFFTVVACTVELTLYRACS